MPKIRNIIQRPQDQTWKLLECETGEVYTLEAKNCKAYPLGSGVPWRFRYRDNKLLLERTVNNYAPLIVNGYEYGDEDRYCVEDEDFSVVVKDRLGNARAWLLFAFRPAFKTPPRYFVYRSDDSQRPEGPFRNWEEVNRYLDNEEISENTVVLIEGSEARFNVTHLRGAFGRGMAHSPLPEKPKEDFSEGFPPPKDPDLPKPPQMALAMSELELLTRPSAPCGGEGTPAFPSKMDRVDGTAFAPRKLRRYTPELLRVTIHRPKDRSRAVQAARAADPAARSLPSQRLGKIERGAKVNVVLDVCGAKAEKTVMDAVWAGDPVDFAFSIEAGDVPQVVVTLRILVEGAQVGTIAFTRPVIEPKTSTTARSARQEKFRPVKSVFLSYSSDDREIVARLATAYQFAQIQCFFDRMSLKPGEEYPPRLLREIERSELFHLCWSKSAAASEWVEKETLHAMRSRRRWFRNRPDITIQMLDGPPWAPHPASLDALNFDDFIRAAIVGYQRGEAG